MSAKRATLYTDGGARGNPGPAGIGFVLIVDGLAPIRQGDFIGEATNNRAEYEALVRGLRRAVAEDVSELTCFLDSELVVKQLAGKYRVKDAGLRPLFLQVQELRRQFITVIFTHVRREKNKEADRLVNEAIDRSFY